MGGRGRGTGRGDGRKGRGTGRGDGGDGRGRGTGKGGRGTGISPHPRNLKIKMSQLPQQLRTRGCIQHNNRNLQNPSDSSIPRSHSEGWRQGRRK